MGGKQSSQKRGQKEETSPAKASLGKDETTPTETSKTIKIEIKDDKLSRPVEIEFEGPRTKNQLAGDALSQDKLFLVTFPLMNNQMAYLDTVPHTLSFKPQPEQTDLSILMVINNVGDLRSPKYQITTVIYPHEYYTVTQLGVLGGQEVRFDSYATPIVAPKWEVDASSQDQYLLSFFSEISTDGSTDRYLVPIIESNENQVIGVSDHTHSVNVFHVTNYNTNTLPIVGLSEGGGE